MTDHDDESAYQNRVAELAQHIAHTSHGEATSVAIDIRDASLLGALRAWIDAMRLNAGEDGVGALIRGIPERHAHGALGVSRHALSLSQFLLETALDVAELGHAYVENPSQTDVERAERALRAFDDGIAAANRALRDVLADDPEVVVAEIDGETAIMNAARLRAVTGATDVGNELLAIGVSVEGYRQRLGALIGGTWCLRDVMGETLEGQPQLAHTAGHLAGMLLEFFDAALGCCFTAAEGNLHADNARLEDVRHQVADANRSLLVAVGAIDAVSDDDEKRDGFQA